MTATPPLARNFLCRLETLLAVLMLAGFGAVAQDASGALPPELSGLEPLLNDEKKLVEALRQYDNHQMALAEWDFNLAKMHGVNGDTALAQTKVEQAQKRIALVRRAYEEALKRYPDNPDAKTYYAELLYDHGTEENDADKGVALWLEVVKAAPDTADAWNNLAIHYSHSGQYDECFNAMDKALALEPDNPDFLFNAAQFFMVHWPQAQAHYGASMEDICRKGMEYSRRAAEAYPDSYVLLQDYATNFYWAAERNLKVDWREAAEAWQKARAEARNNTELFYTWLNEGRVWKEVPNKKKAAACFEEALKLNPKSDVARRHLNELRGGKR